MVSKYPLNGLSIIKFADKCSKCLLIAIAIIRNKYCENILPDLICSFPGAITVTLVKRFSRVVFHIFPEALEGTKYTTFV